MLCSDEGVLFKKTAKKKKTQPKNPPARAASIFLFKGMEILTEFLF